ncbi:MAG: TIGR02996 domain-containing protein [Gemmataceae bacterium]|nr:TIGR02996 domain-containing protein [Gemmataceae bacterium]
MTDRSVFLRAIRAAPADDTPRLVFADWLDEHDDPAWAELIRVQVELEPIHEQLDSPRRRGLADRETELLARHADRWLGPVHDIAAEYPAYGPVFRRGLPESVSLPLDTFLARGGELFAACPTVREVCVYGVAGRGAEMAACPHLAHIETLEIADWPTYQDAGHVLSLDPSPFADLARLRLWLDGSPYDPAATLVPSGPESFRAVEFVQLYGGERLDPSGDASWAAMCHKNSVNAAAGREVVRLVPLFDGRFPIASGVGHGFYPGVNDEGEPYLLAVARDGSGMVIHFTPDGRNEDCSTFGGISPAEVEACRSAARTIRVGEVDYRSHFALRRWPTSYSRDYLADPSHRPAGVTDRWWNHRGGVLKRWLHQGRFVVEWDGREFVLDATGTVVSS